MLVLLATTTTTTILIARHRRRQLVLEIVIVFDCHSATHATWNFVVAVASKVKITVDDGCDGGRNTVAASTVTIAATAAIALRNVDAVAIGGRS